MVNQKRGMSLLIPIVVIAAIVLIVLVVSGTFTGKATSAEEKAFNVYLMEELGLKSEVSGKVSLHDLLDESGRYSVSEYDFEWFDGFQTFLEGRGWKLNTVNLEDIAEDPTLQQKFKTDLSDYKEDNPM